MDIVNDRGCLKHSLIHCLEFSEMHAERDDNYFDFMEYRILAWDNVA